MPVFKIAQPIGSDGFAFRESQAADSAQHLGDGVLSAKHDPSSLGPSFLLRAKGREEGE